MTIRSIPCSRAQPSRTFRPLSNSTSRAAIVRQRINYNTDSSNNTTTSTYSSSIPSQPRRHPSSIKGQRRRRGAGTTGSRPIWKEEQEGEFSAQALHPAAHRSSPAPVSMRAEEQEGNATTASSMPTHRKLLPVPRLAGDLLLMVVLPVRLLMQQREGSYNSSSRQCIRVATVLASPTAKGRG